MLLCAITDRTLLDPEAMADEPGRRARLVERARGWAAGGVDFIQVREKDLEPETLGRLTRAVVQAVREVRGSRTRILLNVGAPEVLVQATDEGWGHDGVHCGGGVPWARQLPEGFVSVACHSAEDVRRARELGAGLAVFAPVFGKRLAGEADSLPGRGLDALAEACRQAGAMPVLALGGVTGSLAGDCLRAGAAGVAGIRLFLDEGAQGWRSLAGG